jgi:archaetidylinositol phosphate synthase
MAGDTWAHRATRPLVRQLLGTPVKPNHLTGLRLATGLIAAGLFATGNFAWAGICFTLSALLDRADGELARLGGLATPLGHRLDLACDFIVNVALFIALGAGLRHGPLATLAPWLGLLAGTTIALIFAAEARLDALASAAQPRRWPVDADDTLFIVGPLAWLGGLDGLLVLAAIGAPLYLAWCGLRLHRVYRRFDHQDTCAS